MGMPQSGHRTANAYIVWVLTNARDARCNGAWQTWTECRFPGLRNCGKARPAADPPRRRAVASELSGEPPSENHVRRNAPDGHSRPAGLLLGISCSPRPGGSGGVAREWARFAKALS